MTTSKEKQDIQKGYAYGGYQGSELLGSEFELALGNLENESADYRHGFIFGFFLEEGDVPPSIQSIYAAAKARVAELAPELIPSQEGKTLEARKIIEGIHQHTRHGECLASPIRQALSHIDDLRAQYANRFNPKSRPLDIWWGINRR